MLVVCVVYSVGLCGVHAEGLYSVRRQAMGCTLGGYVVYTVGLCGVHSWAVWCTCGGLV